MKSIIKTLLFGMFLFVAVGVKAQEKEATKYEFGIVKLYGSGTLGICLEGQQAETRKIDIKQAYQPLFAEVAKLQDEGWVVINQQEEVPGAYTVTTFFLKRKR